MKMGTMEQKHPTEQEPWHHLAFSRQGIIKLPRFQGPLFICVRQVEVVNSAASAVEWPVVQESECSSVSSASLDECAEDFCIDRHQTQSTFRALT
eukprot:symbB.v1.2.001059.t1/scaffold33.1/size517934/11